MSMAESFAKTGFAQFVNSPTGRIVRILVGLGFIGWGYVSLPGTAGVSLIVFGLVGPLAAGSFNLCYISALLGGPLSGTRIAKSKP